jgi:mono/diheme cytochrome c family protein
MKHHLHIAKFAAASAIVAAVAVIAMANRAASGDSDGEDPIGLTEYEIACMSCHGLDGKGDGPKARALSIMPADLTRIAQRNGGTFPQTAIYDMIDGRGVIPAHGRRDMPIWGDRYRKTGDPGEDPSAVDARARALMQALVEYLESIQQN